MLAPWICEHLPDHRIYVEPYAGAASVLLRKRRSFGEVINDLDSEVVNVFRVMRNRRQARELARLCRYTPYAREEFDGAFEPTDDPVEAARRTIVRAVMGFGSDSTTRQSPSGFRATGHRKRGSTPAEDWGRYPEAIGAFTERLQGVTIENRDALEVIRQQDTAGTLFYVDPPYPRSTRSGDGRQQYRHEMTDEQHREMASVLRLARGMVVISGYDCPLYRELFGDWEHVSREALADGARARTEYLWFNAAAIRRGYQQRLFAVGGE